jgi:cytochrome c oxidase subunit 4
MKVSPPPTLLVVTYLALLALFGTTLGLAFVPMGRVNVVVALAIAVTMAALVITSFMKLHRATPLTWAAAATGLAWLAILFILSGTDYLTRSILPS